jgi:hypothetical protein
LIFIILRVNLIYFKLVFKKNYCSHKHDNMSEFLIYYISFSERNIINVNNTSELKFSISPIKNELRFECF